jgi:hypothetical protein
LYLVDLAHPVRLKVLSHLGYLYHPLVLLDLLVLDHPNFLQDPERLVTPQDLKRLEHLLLQLIPQRLWVLEVQLHLDCLENLQDLEPLRVRMLLGFH